MVSTPLLERHVVGNDCDDTDESSTDLDWTLVSPPKPVVAEPGIRDFTAQFWGPPTQHPAPTPVIGRGQTDTVGVCDYPTVVRTRTRVRPGQ